MFYRLIKKIGNILVKTGQAASRETANTGTAHCAAELPENDLRPDPLARNFSRELFAQLLLELPEHRDRMAQAHAAGNYGQLRDCVHQVLGAAVYCEADELEAGLRDLRLALKTEDPQTIEKRFRHAMNTIDTTLQACGYRH